MEGRCWLGVEQPVQDLKGNHCLGAEELVVPEGNHSLLERNPFLLGLASLF